MTTWTLCPPLTQYAADDPLNAAVSRTYLQDNLICCIEQSGHDINCTVSNGSGDAATTAPATTSWAWAAEWIPELIPIYRAHGGGWRELTIGVYAYQTVAFDLRVFLLNTPVAPTINTTTGAVADVTSVAELNYTTGAWELQSGTVTPVDYAWIEPEGITPVIGMPGVYVHLALKISSGTVSISIRNMQVTEAY